MEEPDPTTQVEMNTDMDELCAPRDNAREKQVDEKKALDETKLFQETTTPEGENDVEVNKAVDEATVSEENNSDEKKKDGDENKVIEEIKHNEESSAEEGKSEELKKVTDEVNVSEGKKMEEKKILDAVEYLQETATAEGKVDGEGDNIADEAKVSEETSKDENKKVDNENKAVEEITAIEEDKSVEDSKNEEVNVVNEEARVSDDNKKDDNEKDIGEETLEESNNTVGETLQVSKNTVGENLDESKNMVGETVDESKNIVRKTLDESENCKGDIDEASKKIVGQKIFAIESITTGKKCNAKSLNAEDSSTMLNDVAIVDKEEKIESSEDTYAEDKKNDKLTQINIEVNVVDQNFQVEEKEGGKKNNIEEEIHGASKNAKWDINEVCKGDDVDKASGEENMKRTEEKGVSKGMAAEEEIKKAEKKGNETNLKCEDVVDKTEEEKTDIEEAIGAEDAKNANLTEEERSWKELQNDVASNVDESKMKVEEKNGLKDINDGKSAKGMAEIVDKENKSDMKDASKLEKPNEPVTEIEDKNNLENENDANKAEENNSAQDLKDENVTNKDKQVGEQNNSEADDVKTTDIEEKKSEVKMDVERENRSENENMDVRMTEAEDAQAEDNPEDRVDQITKKEKDTNEGSRKKKRSRSRRKVLQRTGARDKKAEPKEEEKKDSAKKPKAAILSSSTPSIERPVRERKSVERLVEVIEKEPERSFVVEKGFGTPLKDIPKVGYRLARTKPSELKLLHQVLFGRKGKLADLRNHILQFSGFVWHESDEKQKTKVKERLNKCVKENLLSFCDLLCISVSKTNARKENLISKLLDFLSAPHSASENKSDMKDASKLEKPNEPATEIEDKNNLENENDANKAEENNSAQDLKDENVTNKDKEVGEQSNSEADDVETMDIEEKESEVKMDAEREDRSENVNMDVRMIEAEVAQAEDNPEDKVDQITKKDTNGGSRKKKRSRSRRKVSQRTGARDKKAEPKEEEKKDSAKKPKVAILSSPTPSIERPVRERKSVERLVEVIEKEPERSFVVEKGFGTPLKDIPKVGYRLARKKPSELKLLHQVLFGRKGKLADFRNHVLQFSGFVWHESDEKQKTKVKERLDKCVKENLLSFCDLLCISVSKINARKENLISKLLDFLSAPHSASDSLQSVDDQEITKSHKRRRGSNESASKRTDDVAAKSVSKGVKKSKGEEEYDDDNNEEEYGKEGNDSEGDEKIEQSESEKKYKSEKEQEKDEDGVEDSDSKMNKKSVESMPENSGVLKGRVKRKSRSKKTTSVKTSTKVTNSGKNDDSEEKVFARKKKNFGPLRKKSNSKSKVKQISDSILEPKKIEKSDPILEPIKKEKSDPILEPKKKASSSLGPKEKSASVSISQGRVTRLSESKGKSVSKLDSSEKNSTAEKSPVEKSKPEKSSRSNPSKEELRETICGILKKADFNTATFTDILNRLSTHYKANLTTRKASIKLLIQEELTKLSDELEDNTNKKPSEEEEAHRPRAKRARKSKV